MLTTARGSTSTSGAPGSATRTALVSVCVLFSFSVPLGLAVWMDASFTLDDMVWTELSAAATTGVCVSAALVRFRGSGSVCNAMCFPEEQRRSVWNPASTPRHVAYRLHCEGAGNLDRARSRLYRSQVLQENMRLKALAEIYTMHSSAQLCSRFFC